MDKLDPTSPLSKLLKSGTRHVIPKRHAINLSHDRMMMCLIESGSVKRYLINRDGSQSIQHINSVNEVFPLAPLFEVLFGQNIYGGKETYYYQTIDPVVLYSINKDTLIDAVEKDPMMYRDLLYVSGTRLNSNIQTLENLALRTANRKLADLLVYYATKYGRKEKDGIVITVSLTHETIAAILDLTRETVSRCMSRLAERGLIKSGAFVTVIDIEKLQNS